MIKGSSVHDTLNFVGQNTCPYCGRTCDGQICWRCKPKVQPKPKSTCHPQYPAFTGGLCKTCYRKSGKAPKATCHPDRARVARGVCEPCYNKSKSNLESIKYRARRYGLTAEQHQQLVDSQNNMCAICSKPPPIGKVLDIDHDHRTGRVRGLLCNNCNRGLGFFQDSAQILENAVVYINRQTHTECATLRK